ncbi:MAG: Na+/H+ antiporter subunit D [Thermoflexales bacterium]|nr:Na+/H+ antiporter subunit D [Thermoflexales bacterium]
MNLLLTPYSRFIVLPVLIPFFTAVTILLLRRRLRAVRWVALAGSTGGLVTALVLLAHVADGRLLVTQLGGWPAPYGITFVVDLFSAMMLTMASLTGTLVLVYTIGSLDAERERMGFYALYQFLLMGVCGSFITGDLFNLYVFFEIMLVSSFGLMTLGGERCQLEGGLKYVVINMVSSTLFVSALGVLYGVAGTLNMADLSQRLLAAPPGLVAVLASMFLVIFGIKAGLFPLYFWLPASYHTPPPAVSALFAGLLTKVGVYALIRVFTLLFLQDTAYTHALILVIAGLTMVVGVLGAVAQYNFRRLLAFHIISQIGYMIMGLALFTPLALAGAILHIIHNMVVKTNLFLVSGVAERLGGTPDLKKLGGLATTQPALAGLFLVSALSLAGLPPLSGFFSKFTLVLAGLESRQYLIVAVSLAVSFLTLFSMIKIWNEAFWKPALPLSVSPSQLPCADPQPLSAHAPAAGRPPGWLVLAPIATLALLSLGLGLGAGGIYSLAQRAAESLLDPSAYVAAVLTPTTGGP